MELPFKVAVVGRLSEQKGQDVAIGALPHTKVPVELHLYGEGVEESSLRALASSLGVDHAVVFHGRVTDARIAYEDTNAVCAPSRWDGLSLAVLEAMSCGLPVVATDIPATSQLSTTILTVPTDDQVALAGALDRLHEDDELRSRLGRESRDLVVEVFSLESQLSRYLDLYRQALD
jgi:glycosyltransferase involved in cell wall biosynthesis